MKHASRQTFAIVALLAVVGVVAIAGVVAAHGGAPQTPAATAKHPSTSPLGRFKLWVNPDSPAAAQMSAWKQLGEDKRVKLIARIASEPTAVWLTAGGQPRSRAAALVDAAHNAHAVAQIVLYYIPHRDCGQYSAGGAPSGKAYLAWVRQVADALGHHSVIVILEPDAVDQAAAGCLGATGARARYRLLADAGRLLRRDPDAHIYLDAGDAGWLTPTELAGPLRLSGVAHDAGFSLNVSNFYTNAQSIAYGRRLSDLVHGKHFVIDSSRNGNGPPPAGQGVNQWCNPAGRALGETPTTHTHNARVDAFLWIKYPGESDGSCHPGDPPAGSWWPAYALGLVRRAQG